MMSSMCYVRAPKWLCLSTMVHIDLPEQALGRLSPSLGLVVDDKHTKLHSVI